MERNYKNKKMEESKEALQLKIIVIGEPAVGKTSTIRKYCHGVFDNLYRATVCYSLIAKTRKYSYSRLV